MENVYEAALKLMASSNNHQHFHNPHLTTHNYKTSFMQNRHAYVPNPTHFAISILNQTPSHSASTSSALYNQINSCVSPFKYQSTSRTIEPISSAGKNTIHNSLPEHHQATCDRIQGSLSSGNVYQSSKSQHNGQHLYDLSLSNLLKFKLSPNQQLTRNSFEKRDSIEIRFSASSSDDSQLDDNGMGGEYPFGHLAGRMNDKKARKRDQNRRAAFNYRRKKMHERDKMLEEEMSLVFSKVCLSGYVDELEDSVVGILKEKTNKILDKKNNSIYFLCPVCVQSCDDLTILRTHLNVIHNTIHSLA